MEVDMQSSFTYDFLLLIKIAEVKDFSVLKNIPFNHFCGTTFQVIVQLLEYSRVQNIMYILLFTSNIPERILKFRIEDKKFKKLNISTLFDRTVSVSNPIYSPYMYFLYRLI